MADQAVSGPAEHLGVAQSEDITLDELQLASRNHAMPLETLIHDITPVGLHYLLIHFDIPAVDAGAFRLSVDGHVASPLTLTLDDIRSQPAETVAVTLECAGNGRALLSPRPLSQPWLNGAVGTARWTGVPLRAVLERAGVLDGAVEVLFTGLDRGVQGEVEQDYQRSLSVQEALRDDVLLAHQMNGEPLLPQHGFPLRLMVPGWYGMTSVKWLRAVTVLTEPFTGYQQAVAYRTTLSEDDPGVPVTRILPRSLMVPPGIPEFFTRTRVVDPGRHVLRGRAWSGGARVARVEVSVDGGRTWADASLGEPLARYAWAPWEFAWDDAEPGEYELLARATDAAGNVQPVDQPWNLQGLSNNMCQRVPVVVREPGGGASVD